MRIRQEVRRLSEALGIEIRETLVNTHVCSQYRIPNGMCVICDLSRVRGMELAALVYCRNNRQNIPATMTVLHNESELIDLLGREKVERKARAQLRKAKDFYFTVCKSCGKVYTCPFTRKELGQIIVFQRNFYPNCILRGECHFCGFQNNLNIFVDPHENPKDEGVIMNLQSLMQRHGVRVSTDTRKDTEIIAVRFPPDEEREEPEDLEDFLDDEP